MGHVAKATLALGLFQQGRIIGSAHGRREGAFEFLPVFGLVHAAAGGRQFGGGQIARPRGREAEAAPAAGRAFPSGLLPDIVQQVVRPVRGPAEERASLPVGQHGPDDLRPDAAGHVRRFVQHDVVKVEAAQGVRIVQPV